jgi:hypothetical protein
MSLPVLDRPDSGGHVADIIQGVENPKDPHSIFGGQADKLFHHIVGIMAVAKQILPPQKHLERCLDDMRLQAAQPLPWIFVQKPDAGIEGGASPCLQRKKSDGIHIRGNRQHIRHPHSGGDEGLMGISESRIRDFERHDAFFSKLNEIQPILARLMGYGSVKSADPLNYFFFSSRISGF